MGRKRSKTKLPKLFLWLIAVCAIAWFVLLIAPDSVNDASNEIIQQYEGLTETIESEPIDYGDMESAILTCTNEERENYGLKPLIWDDKLASIARDHSEDMAENNFFSHINLRGEDPTDRAVRYGYPIRKSLGGGWYSEGIAENIGKMPTGQVVGIGYVANNADSIARAQVASWMESTGHRENILNSQYDRIGIGVAYDGLYYVATQNFL